MIIHKIEDAVISASFYAYHSLQAIKFRIAMRRGHRYGASRYQQYSTLTWAIYHKDLLLEGRRPSSSEPHQIMSEVRREQG